MALLDGQFLADVGEVASYGLMTTVFGRMTVKDYQSYSEAANTIVKGTVVNNEEIKWYTEDDYLQEIVNKTSYGKSSNISGADNIADAARLKEYYKQAEKYGTGSIKELENGRFRFYEEIKPARTNGEMAGARHVREWDSYSGLKRDWYETIDHNGNIRQVRPDPNITGE